MKNENIILITIAVLIASAISCVPVFSSDITYYQVLNAMIGVFDVKTPKGNEGFAEKTFELAQRISQDSKKKKELTGQVSPKEKSILTLKKDPSKIVQNNDQLVIFQKKDAGEISKEEVNKKYFQEDKEKIYKFIDEDSLREEILKSPLKNIISKLTSGNDSKTQNKALIEAFLISKEKIKLFLPFMRSRDYILLKNISLILGISNYSDSFLSFKERIQQEKNEDILSFLYVNLGMLTKFEVEPYLNLKFVEESNDKLLIALSNGLSYRADSNTINRARELIKKTLNNKLKIALFYLISYQGLEEHSIKYAKNNLSDVDKTLKVKMLGLFMFSKDKTALDYLIKNKKIFYKSKDLLDMFEYVKAFISSSNFEDFKRLNYISLKIEHSKTLLAELALFAARLWNDQSLLWLKEFASNNYLIEYEDFVYALNLRNISLKTAMTREQEKEKNSKERIKSKKLWAQVVNAGTLSFENIENLQDVVIDGRTLRDQELKEKHEILTGDYMLKLTFKNSQTIWRKISLKTNFFVQIKILPQTVKSIVNSIGISLAPIPKGDCILGNKKIDEEEHKVSFSQPLFVGKYEVTNEQYELFDKYHNKERDNKSLDDNQPVILVSWYDALGFCNWLSDKEGFLNCYDENTVFNQKANGYRLLTEAEWEYAAKSGVSENLYPFGEYLADLNSGYKANYFPKTGNKRDGFVFTAPVGSYPSNDFGLFDMAGNVSEWCYDWYDERYYKQLNLKALVNNPIGPKRGSLKVCRGGSWYSREALKCAYREFAHPGEKSNTRGFRICRNMSAFQIEVISKKIS